MIKNEDGKYCLYSQDGAKKLGCFPTEELAQKHEAKIKAIIAARQSAFGTMTTAMLAGAGIAWPLDKPTDLSLLVDDEQFRFVAAYGEFEKLFGVTLRQDSFDVLSPAGDKTGSEWEVCIIEQGMAKPSEGNAPIFWSEEVLSDPNLHTMLESSPVRIYQQGGDGAYNHAPLEVIDQAGHKLTANTAGLLTNVRYGEFKGPGGGKKKGVLGTLHVTMSDTANLMRKGWELGKRVLGLSVDAKIMKDFVRNAVMRVSAIKETTLVSHPAAGGWLLALRASAYKKINEVTHMEKLLKWLEANKPELYKKLEVAGEGDYQALLLEAFQVKQIEEGKTVVVDDKDAAQKAAEVKAAQDKAAAEAQAAVLPTIEETQATVETALKMATGLPDDFKNLVRSEYKGRQAKPVQVMETIARQQAVAAKFAKPGSPLTIKPEDELKVALSEQDKYNKAMLGLFEGKNIDGVARFGTLRQSFYEIAKVQGYRSAGDLGRAMFNEVPYGLVPRDSGITQEQWFSRLRQMKESQAYGDADLRQAALQTSSWTIAFGNTLNRYLLKIYLTPELQDYKKIISRIDNVQDFKSQIFTRIGGYSNLPTVSEGSTYTEATHPAEESVNYSLVKRGEMAFITWEAFVNDDIGAIKQAPQKVMLAAAQTKYEFFLDLLRSPGTWAPDSVAIFHASHGNLSSTAFSSVALQAIILAMRDQTELTSGKPIRFNPKIVVYPSELDRAVHESIKDNVSNFGVSGTFNRNETLANWLQQQFQMDGVRVPYWTDANDYCVVANPAEHDTIIAGFFGGREEPEMWFADRPDSYHMFTSDKIALKVRDIYGGTYGDYRSLHKAVVA